MNDVRPKSKLEKVFGLFKAGMDSYTHPSDQSANPSGYSMAENTLHRGGVVQTRPGMSLRATIAGSNLQGFTVFTPKNDAPRALVAVDGLIYTAKYPFESFTVISGLQFDPLAEFVVFKTCIQSAQENPDGSISLVQPREVVVIQDGSTQAAYWTGASAKHTNKIPIGLWMEWASSRLWVISGTRLYAGNIADPLSFSEDTYLAERSAFELPGEGTGIIQTADEQGLLVFTSETTTAFQAGILDRAKWQETSNFSRVIMPAVGCVAGRTPINQYGLTMWLSKRGIVSLNSAIFTKQSSQLLTLDDAMHRSKRNIASDTNSACAISFQNFSLFSVPSGDRYNAHTWAMDVSPSGESQQSQPQWSSIWSGFRPVQWAKSVAGGKDRIYCASFGKLPYEGNKIHIWEAFDSSGEDQSNRIRCQLETNAFTTNEPVRLKYIEIDACEISGVVDVEAYIGGVFGPWRKVLDAQVKSQRGCFGSPQLPLIERDSLIRAFRPQSRTLRSEEFIAQDESCQSEGGFAGVDKSIQVLIQWRGRMGIKTVKIVVEPTTESGTGRCQKSDTVALAITERGEELP